MINTNLVKASVAAKQLGKSSTTIRRMIQDKRLVGEKNGSRYWVNRASLDQFIETGDGRIEQTTLKPNIKSDSNGKITELIGTKLVPLGRNVTSETSETGADTPDFSCLKGPIQHDAVAFFDRCKGFPFSSLTILARCVDFDRNDYIEQILERRFGVMHDKIPIIDLLGDALWTIIDDYFQQGYFPDDPFDKERRIFRDDILWRLELRDNGSSIRPDAFCFPFKAIYDGSTLLDLEAQGAREVINATT